MDKYRKAIFILTYTKERDGIEYLLLKRKLHWRGWEFPKGGIEKGEKIIDAIKREVKEETGLKPLNIKKFNISGSYKYDKVYPDRDDFSGQSYKLYAVEVKKGKVKIDKREHSKSKWLGFEKALKKLEWPNQKKSLMIVNEWLTR